MSAPLYFLPGVYRQHLVQGSRLVPAVLEARGLLPIFGDVTDVLSETSLSEITTSGPGGQSGTMLVPLAPGGEPPVRLGFKPDFQTWHDEGNFWIGFDNELPTKPADLQRRKMISGYRTTLAGEQWRVPILRRADDSTELPCSYRLGRDGKLTEVVRELHRPLWEQAREIVDWFVRDELQQTARQQMPRIVDWCVRILAVNYRFDWTLQNHLAVIDTDDLMLLLNLAIDWPATQYAAQVPQEVSVAGVEAPA